MVDELAPRLDLACELGQLLADRLQVEQRNAFRESMPDDAWEGWFRTLAEHGDADAQCSLGALYATGCGVPQDEGQAMHWYQLAEDQENAVAQTNLGAMYATWDDEDEAVRWYRLAADQGLSEGQFNLGVMYAEGRGVLQNEAEAVCWYRLAAEQGLAEAQFNLGGMYAEGRGAPQDDVQAHMLLNLFGLTIDR